jgi:glycosyltransferase involved in cell wall biosynthesis
MEKKITILIPVYNEQKTLLKLLKEVSFLKVEHGAEIIVINDGSIDNSKKIIEENQTYYDQFISYEKNKGKGFAIREGLKKSKGDYIIFQDADLEYDPQDIVKFLELIDKFAPDVILGSRFNYDKYSKSHNVMNKIGNLVLTSTFNLLYNTTFTDIYSCYLCVKKKFINENSLKANGFDQQAEILTEVVKKGKNFFEVPINYNGRSKEDGKKIRFYHFFPVFFKIILKRFY